ncbi:MAG: SDR family NAD(P)-dependent oxidoreductase, partial [Gemmatimonadota bacterium]
TKARSRAHSAGFVLGACIGASTEAAAALLLYTEQGFLGTAGFLVGLALAALGLGLWVGVERAPERRRWVSLVIAYAAAAVYAVLLANEPALRGSAAGGALAAFFLLAQPAYAAGAVFSALASKTRGSAAAPLFGAAIGVLAAALILIPRLQPSVIFLMAAAVLLLVALIETRRPSQFMNTTELSLNGKCAIVTGVGDRGQLGFVVAQQLIAAGARVCITDVQPSVQDIAHELGATGVQSDLTNDDDVARLITTAQERLGRVDILVNVAGGLSVIKPIAETSRAEWEREVQRNAETVFLVSRAALPALRAARGAIINFAAPAGLRAVPQLGAYSAAKAAVVAFTRALAVEEKANGLRVNALAPGMIDTEQNRKSAGPDTKWVTREQIANVVLFLASDASSGITGETIHVLGDGLK